MNTLYDVRDEQTPVGAFFVITEGNRSLVLCEENSLMEFADDIVSNGAGWIPGVLLTDAGDKAVLEFFASHPYPEISLESVTYGINDGGGIWESDTVTRPVDYDGDPENQYTVSYFPHL
jgi:hypothetical protein